MWTFGENKSGKGHGEGGILLLNEGHMFGIADFG
jgi:hypothetical protein